MNERDGALCSVMCGNGGREDSVCGVVVGRYNLYTVCAGVETKAGQTPLQSVREQSGEEH
eukprot:scaffold1446_cov175-Ochromonas_danica.AAC.7